MAADAGRLNHLAGLIRTHCDDPGGGAWIPAGKRCSPWLICVTATP
jgi:hypothetical protein